MTLQIIKGTGPDGSLSEAQLASLNEIGSTYYAAVYAMATEGASPEVKAIFDAWWNGGKLWVWNDATREHDWAEPYASYGDAIKKEAGDRILEATSRGCG